MIRNVSMTLILAWAIFAAVQCETATAQPAPPAVDRATPLAPFLRDDTFLVFAIDLDAIDPPAFVARMSSLFDAPQPSRQQASVAATVVQGALGGLRNAGVHFVYLVGGVNDIQVRGGPIVVIPTDESTVDNMRTQIQALATMLQPTIGARGRPEVEIQRHPSGSLIIGSPPAVERYMNESAIARTDLTGPLARLVADGASVAAVVAPGRDTRRVLRELWPTPPAPAANLDGNFLAERLQHLEVALHLSANPTALVAVETTDQESANRLRQTMEQARQVLTSANKQEMAESVRLSLDAFNPHVEGTRLVGRLSAEALRQNDFAGKIAQAFDGSRERARQSMRMSIVRQLTLAMLNYESGKRNYPPAAIRDGEGRPLLSWRVAILPHLGSQEAELYKQFHLNEPWDSLHNRTLLSRMPELYADPDPRLASLNREGKTTFQVPVGPATIFYKNEGTRLREITDGASRTIMIVEVVPERAVEWTNPADWEVDMRNPLNGVKRTDREAFATGFADAHVEAIRNDINPQVFRGLLTREGKEEASNTP